MKKAICIPAVIIPVTLLINLIARISTGFSDFYVERIDAKTGEALVDDALIDQLEKASL